MAEQAAASSTIPAAAGTGPASTPATTESLDISRFIEPDGKFKEGWQKALLPEDLQTSKFYALFQDVQGILKAAGHKEIELGKYRAGKGVLPINEKSSPTEIEAFRTALGVPKDGTGYQYTPPEDISSEDLSPQFMKETFDALNKSHHTQGQVDTVMNLYTNHLRLVEKAVDEELAKKVSDATNRLEAKWGDQMEAKTNLAKAFITKMTSQMNKEEYEELFGREIKILNADGTTEITREGGINDPDFAPLRPLLLDLFAELEEKYGVEGSALDTEVAGQPRLSLQQQLEDASKAVNENVALKSSLDSKDRAKYDELLKARDILYKRMFPT
jgi:hypothetical protein